MVDEALQKLLGSFEVGELLSRQVLLVDDEVQNLIVLERVLEDDYVVHLAGSGAEALSIIESTPLDIIIADQRMPGMTGVELLEKVRQDKPDIAGIVLTAYTDSPAIMAAINRAAAFRFLTKPWSPSDIMLAVRLASQYVFHRRAVRRLVELLAQRNDELAGALDNLKATQRKMVHMERLGTMGRLTAGITHDLRSLLAGLVLLEGELAEECQGPQAASSSGIAGLSQILSVMSAGARNLLDTILALNQYAHGESVHISPSTVGASEIVGDALTVMRMDLDARKRTLAVDVQADLPEIECDRRRLTQVLVNLIRNAVQATEPQHTIRITASGLPNGGLVFAVEDEGPGVPQELRSKLFEPFVSSKGPDGMGMGLYMARLIAESHGGKIRCLDGTWGGARFEIILGGHSGPQLQITGDSNTFRRVDDVTARSPIPEVDAAREAETPSNPDDSAL